jgi:hypothetical protein
MTASGRKRFIAAPQRRNRKWQETRQAIGQNLCAEVLAETKIVETAGLWQRLQFGASAPPISSYPALGLVKAREPRQRP